MEFNTVQKQRIAEYLQVPLLLSSNVLRGWCSIEVGGPTGFIDVVVIGGPSVNGFNIEDADISALNQKQATFANGNGYNFTIGNYFAGLNPLVSDSQFTSIIQPYLIGEREYGVFRMPDIINICGAPIVVEETFVNETTITPTPTTTIQPIGNNLSVCPLQFGSTCATVSPYYAVRELYEYYKGQQFGNNPNTSAPIRVTFQQPVNVCSIRVLILQAPDFFTVDGNVSELSVATKNINAIFYDQTGTVVGRQNLYNTPNGSDLTAYYEPTQNLQLESQGSILAQNRISYIDITAPPNYIIVYFLNTGVTYTPTEQPDDDDQREGEGEPAAPTWRSCADGILYEGVPPSDYVEDAFEGEGGGVCWRPTSEVGFIPSLNNIQFFYQRATPNFPEPLSFVAENTSNKFSYEVQFKTNNTFFVVSPSVLNLPPKTQQRFTISIENNTINQLDDGRTGFALQVETIPV
jgi:hypothetical protein